MMLPVVVVSHSFFFKILGHWERQGGMGLDRTVAVRDNPPPPRVKRGGRGWSASPHTASSALLPFPHMYGISPYRLPDEHWPPSYVPDGTYSYFPGESHPSFQGNPKNDPKLGSLISRLCARRPIPVIRRRTLPSRLFAGGQRF